MTAEATIELSDDERSALRTLLATLLPGDERRPGATALELEGEVCRLTTLGDGHREALNTFLAALGTDFAGMEQVERESRVRAGEADHPAEFAVVRLLAYNAYYTSGSVLQTLQDRCGYEARPPQPKGYALEPFDDATLERVRAREPFWRRAD